MAYAVRVGATAIFLAVLFSTPLLVSALEFRTGEQPSFPEGETLTEDLYLAGGNVTSAGSVRGDLFAVGGSLLLSGPVSADLIAGGGNITVLGTIGDDARLGGGTIIMQSQVGGDVVFGGGQVTIAGVGIGGDLAGGGGAIRIDAPVAGDVRIGGGEVYLNSSVQGNVEIWADKVTLGPGAVIAGDFIYTAKEEAALEEGASVSGETTFTERKSLEGAAKAGVGAFVTLWFFSKFLMTLVGALAIALIFRRYSKTLVETTMARPLLEIGRGLIVFIVLPIASLILLFSVIGVPFGILGLLTFAGILIFVSLAAPIVIGSFVHRLVFRGAEYEVSWKTVLLGAILYSLLTLIPFVGWLAKFVLILATLGAATKIKIDILDEWR